MGFFLECRLSERRLTERPLIRTSTQPEPRVLTLSHLPRYVLLCIEENLQGGCVNAKQEDMSEMIYMLKSSITTNVKKKRFNNEWICMKIPGTKL
ncbi:uncharacterized protein LOC112906261 isoform X2 [Agrilus planipennis]|uniref:Uncharacterized protein LOC112906261 isoform X2 n=1 Tax=Agrilus planipennis TaxID=224129 RepID=A0A7F5RJ54_AGRPL|nr:uncharacterized protein LOC112906261 isoform X2 [Agrilus planipennis]